MNTKILYNFTIYFRHPRLFGACDLFSNTSSSNLRWDTSVNVTAFTVEEAMKEIVEGYSHMEVVKVDYPTGCPTFPQNMSSVESKKLRAA